MVCLNPEIRKNTLVIYHAGCWDGMAAAYAAYCELGNSADYIAMNYDQLVPVLTGYSKVYILDYSFNLKAMEWLIREYPGIEWILIDHHEGALDLKVFEKLDNFNFIFDNDESGATLAYNYFNYKPLTRYFPPRFFEYIKDRDLWRFELASSRDVSSYIRSKEKNFENCALLEDMIKNNFAEVITAGKALSDYNELLIREAVKKVHFFNIAGYEVPAVNSCTLHSEIAEALYQEYNPSFSVVYFIRGDGKKQWSLRSKKGGFNVCDIAKKFGGSGHASSSGFESSYDFNFELIR